MESDPDSNDPFYSPNPVVRQQAWAELFEKEGATIVHRVRRRSPWLDLDDAVHIVHDAFMTAPEYVPTSPRFHPPSLIQHRARNRAISLLRRKSAKRRGGNSPAISLDTVNPDPETDHVEYFNFPEVWLREEILRLIEKLPRLQQAVAIAMLENPHSSASQVADHIKDKLGNRPTNGAVESARTVIYQKLKPYLQKIRQELIS